MPRFIQRALFCRICGNPPAWAGLCVTCYRRHRRSLRFFAGLREAVLRRDGCRCQACGAGNQRAVHHRRPGIHFFDWLITLCPACHAVVHKLRAHRRWLPEALLVLWREQHSSVPLQLQLEIFSAPGEQGREDRPGAAAVPQARKDEKQKSGAGSRQQGESFQMPSVLYIEGWDWKRSDL